jgi:Flp pilus assembly protein TadD
VNNLAILLTARGDTDEAERLFRRAVAAGQAPALHNLAILLDHRGEAAEAAQLRERFRRAQEPRPSGRGSDRV